MTTFTDHRQRFFIKQSPVRGDIVRLSSSYAKIIAQKDYPEALKCLLGEMLTAASLLIGTLKVEGRLSIQIQSSDESSLLSWAMAECDHNGDLRGLAKWKAETAEQKQAWIDKTQANEAFSEFGALDKGVLFINVQPKGGNGYQSIVERSSDSLEDCLAHYQRQSAQIPTVIKLASDGLQAGGILVQMLPLSQDELAIEEQNSQIGLDDDLWTRLTVLTNTVKHSELTKVDSNKLLFLLYNEEDVVIPDSVALQFGCTCSKDKCASAIIQLGKQQAIEYLQESLGKIEMDCGFCGTVYPFFESDVIELFA